MSVRVPVQPVFLYHRVQRGELPPVDERIVDVALLDMNHSWPNLGHGSFVQAVEELCERIRPFLGDKGLQIRLISFDVRNELALPDPQDDRFRLYLGTGGPGQYDPRQNDGTRETSQGIAEDPSWHPRLEKLFDSILDDPRRALVAVCHSYGLLCMWAGVAKPTIRNEAKGGKSSGVVWNELDERIRDHPWFCRFSTDLRDGLHFAVLDNRLFDLIPVEGAFGGQVIPLAWDVVGQKRGDALTMVELARDPGSEFPRVYGVNFHPEIIDRQHVMKVMSDKLTRREVTEEWYRERLRIFRDDLGQPGVELLTRMTSQFTFLAPIEHHLKRMLTERFEIVGPAPEVQTESPFGHS